MEKETDFTEMPYFLAFRSRNAKSVKLYIQSLIEVPQELCLPYLSQARVITYSVLSSFRKAEVASFQGFSLASSKTD